MVSPSRAPPSVILYFSGLQSPDGYVEGMALGGPRIARGGWSADQRAISQAHGRRLAALPGQHGAPHKNDVHFSEIAHHRPQSTGGFTDSSGATPASVGLNVADMGTEEAFGKLSRRFSATQARFVQAIRVRGTGIAAGTIDVREQTLLLRNNVRERYRPALIHVEEGERNTPDTNEIGTIKQRWEAAAAPFAGALKPGGRTARSSRATAATATAAAATPTAATSLPAHTATASASGAASGFEISATATPRTARYGAGTRNDSSKSNYLTGSRSPGGTFRSPTGTAAYMKTFEHEIARGNHDTAAATASAAHPSTSVRPLYLPPSPPSIPSRVAAAAAASRSTATAAVAAAAPTAAAAAPPTVPTAAATTTSARASRAATRAATAAATAAKPV